MSWLVAHEWWIAAVACAFVVGWIAGLVEADTKKEARRGGEAT